MEENLTEHSSAIICHRPGRMHSSDFHTQKKLRSKPLRKGKQQNCVRLSTSLDGQRIQQHPELHSSAQGSELFSHFFSEKIDKLLSGLQCFNTIDRPTYEKRCSTDCIHVFDPTTNAEITVICGITDKTCVLDPLLIS